MNTICKSCGSHLKYYDKVPRIIRTKGRLTKRIDIPRYRCDVCGSIHRCLPENLFPYKQYEVEVIKGVIEGIITSDTIGYEDYPCDATMVRWRTQKVQILL